MRGASTTYVKQVLIAVGIAALAVLIVLAIGIASHTLLLVFGGVLIAVLLRGLADGLSSFTRMPTRVSLLLVTVGIVAVFGFGGWYLSGEIAGQFDELGRSLAAAWQQARSQLERYGLGRDLLDTLSTYHLSPDDVGTIGKMAAAALAGMSGLVLSLIVGLYVAVNPSLYRRGLLRLVPIAYRPRANNILGELHDTLRNWLIGTLFLMILVGTATTIGLWLLGIPLALALGIIMFLLEFIPYLGPILGAIPAILLASTLGPHDMLFVILLYWGVQSAEAYLLSPLVFQRSIHVPPLLTMSAQVVLGTMLGFLGVIFATPLIACAMVLVGKLYVEDALGDRLDRPLEAV